MNILLTIPKTDIFFSFPDIGLGYVAQSLVKRNHKVFILDYKKDSPTVEEVIRKFKPDFIGIKIYSKDRELAKELIKKIRRISDAKIVVGGYHITCVPEDLNYLNSDFGFVGDGDFFYELVEGKEPARITNMIWNKDRKIIINERVFVDVNENSSPAWSLINPNDYEPSPEGFIYKSFPIAPIITTRGCPFDCSFCSVQKIMGKKLRHRNLNNIIREIEMLYSDFRVREFHINDDNFTANKKFAKEFCRMIILLRKKLKTKMFFSCPNGVRIDSFDDELLELMKKAGFYSLSLGLESGSQRILDHMEKKLTINKIKELVEQISKYKFNLNGFFIIGYPIEERDDIERTIEFANSLPLNRAYFNLFSPLPCTRISEQMNLKMDYSKMTGEVPSIPLSNVTVEELKKFQRRATLLFYFRPKTLVKFILSIHFNQLKFLFKRFFALMR